MIGLRGRSRATADAVRPVKVGTRIALAPSASARSQAAFDIALPTVGLVARLGNLVAVAEAAARPRARSGPCTRPPRPGTAPMAVSPESISADGAVEDRVGDVARLGAGRLGAGDHRLEHLGGGDHRLPALERGEDDPLLQRAAPAGADLDAEVAAGDHDRVGLARGSRRAPSTASAFSIFAITCASRARARRSASRSSRTSAAERTNESATKSTPSSSANVEVARRSFSRERRDRERDAREVHALVRADDAADDDRAARAAAARPPRPAAGRGRRRSGRRGRAAAPRRSRPGATGSSPSPCSVLAGRRRPRRRAELRSAPSRSPTRSFGPWRSAISASGRPTSACDVADDCARARRAPRACRARS